MLNALVIDRVLPDRVMMGWHPSIGEEFPTPCIDEIVIFEDYFYRGFGVPIHSSWSVEDGMVYCVEVSDQEPRGGVGAVHQRQDDAQRLGDRWGAAR